MRKLLSLGTQSFSNVRETGKTIYIDKTKHLRNLINLNESPRIFLSRPRRFGKSLLCSTLKSLFLGEKKYFKNLFIEDKRDWNTKYPVLHISFGFGVTSDPKSLSLKLEDIILFNCMENNIKYKELNANSVDGKLKELIMILQEKHGQKVAVIIDEYDKPILDMITNPELANKNKEELKNFYAVLKDADNYIKFVFITGVSKFSKVSLFSGLNNLDDISFSKDYATICGYTKKEIVDNYGPEGYLDGVDLEKIRTYYNGYNFNCQSKNCKVYNPYGILNFFHNHNEYQNYWFQSATPTFLIEMLKKNNYPVIDFENVKGGSELFESFDVDNIDLITLMFQSGYLTIKSKNSFSDIVTYKLGIPNKEVRDSLNNHIMRQYFGFKGSTLSNKTVSLYESMQAKDINKFVDVIKSIFAGIPYSNYTKNDISKYEGFYSCVLYSFLCATGMNIVFEDITNHGRIDITVSFEDMTVIIELKVEKTGNDALTQIKEKNYADKYNSENSQIFLLGLNFSEEEKNVESWDFEKI